VAFLTVENITKFFPGVRALDDVSVEFEKGNVHALMGENGAGKSTLGKIIAGIYTADHGTIRIEGQEVRPTDPLSAQKLGVAIVHQELAFCPNMTVAENLLLGGFPTNGGFMDWAKLIDRARAFFYLFTLWYICYNKQKSYCICSIFNMFIFIYICLFNVIGYDFYRNSLSISLYRSSFYIIFIYFNANKC
jgi:ABC-type Fe3+/spermidine/putrescine transport system ATPase subunit